MSRNAYRPAQPVAEGRATGRGGGGLQFGRWVAPREEMLTLGLVALVLLSVTWPLDKANWVEGLPSLSGWTLLSLMVGFALSRRRLPAGLCHTLAGLVGAGMALGLAAALMPGEGWDDRVQGLLQELRLWGQAVGSAGSRDGSVEFGLLLLGLFWTLGYLAAWHFRRSHRAWALVIPSGLVLFVALSYLPESYYFHFLFYLAAAVLLLVHLGMLRRQQEWQRAQVSGPPLAGLLHSSIVLGFGLIAVLIAWRVPSPSLAPLGAVLEWTRPPWESALDQFGRLFAALPARKPFPSLVWPETVPFGGAVQPGEQLLFTIKSPEPYYWRMSVYDVYTRQGWSNSAGLSQPFTEEVAGVEETPGRRRSSITVKLNASSQTLFSAGEPVASSVPALALVRPSWPRDILRVSSLTELRVNRKYTMRGSVSLPKPEPLRQAGISYPSWVTEAYLQLPGDLPARVRRLSRELVVSAATPYDKAVAIRNYLLTLPYSTSIPAPPPGSDGVDYFLFSRRAGYCDYYASAMVVMLRAVGVPARFVLGYATGVWDSGKQAYLVREKNYHSWPEVYFPGHGWVEFEPTPPEAVEFGGMTQGLGELDDLSLATSAADPLDIDITPETEEIGVEAAVGREEVASPPSPLRWWWGGVILMAALGLSLAWHRYWGRPSGWGSPAEVYARMCRLASLAQLPPRPQQTPLEYASYLSAAMPGRAGEIALIAAAYARTRYGPRKYLKVEEWEEMVTAWRSLRPSLLSRSFRLAGRVGNKGQK